MHIKCLFKQYQRSTITCDKNWVTHSLTGVAAHGAAEVRVHAEYEVRRKRS